ncbi:Uncharacterised protein [Arcanobacterium haemolyticum]|nr:Uncharacterised protein [Arcanobacterium haemolyticum]
MLRLILVRNLKVLISKVVTCWHLAGENAVLCVRLELGFLTIFIGELEILVRWIDTRIDNRNDNTSTV